MLTVYKHTEDGMVSDTTVADATKGSWINLVNPDPDELALINIMTEIPTDVLKTALDMEERSHIETEDNYIFVVINIPALRGTDTYDTVPLGIFVTPDFFITICLEESEVLYPFLHNQVTTFYTYKKTRFLFQIMYRTATLFLRYLQQINRRTDDIEIQLRHTTKNKDFFQLLELQKSMTYFTSALRTNGTVMERLLRLRNHEDIRHLLKMYEEDEDLLEDVTIENKQAIEMVEMYSNILMNMMNAFTSIISNNLNMVMKLLAAVTILLAVPTAIFSLWGVNVPVPFADKDLGFVSVVVTALVATLVAGFWLWKNDFFDM
ncbi:MAG: magnesium transporter CorA family protein [Veillonellaceae bacterium]|nr:magnesium transporter CorA family protein [Veillonellaceae bacterium]